MTISSRQDAQQVSRGGEAGGLAASRPLDGFLSGNDQKEMEKPMVSPGNHL